MALLGQQDIQGRRRYSRSALPAMAAEPMFTEVARGIILVRQTPGDRRSMIFDGATKPSLLLSWVWGVSWDFFGDGDFGAAGVDGLGEGLDEGLGGSGDEGEVDVDPVGAGGVVDDGPALEGGRLGWLRGFGGVCEEDAVGGLPDGDFGDVGELEFAVPEPLSLMVRWRRPWLRLESMSWR